MKYLLDTNIISELVKKQPNTGILSWIKDRDENSLFLSVLTFGELLKGITKLNDKVRAEKLQTWLDQELKHRFEGRTLLIDQEIAETWGRIQGTNESRGIKLPVMDSLIAATAITYNLIVVTRNVYDIERCQAAVFNPWG